MCECERVSFGSRYTIRAEKAIYNSCPPSQELASELFHSKQKQSWYDNTIEIIQKFEAEKQV